MSGPFQRNYLFSVSCEGKNIVIVNLLMLCLRNLNYNSRINIERTNHYRSKKSHLKSRIKASYCLRSKKSSKINF